MNGERPSRKPNSERPPGQAVPPARGGVAKGEAGVADAVARARLEGMFKDGLSHFQAGDVTQAIRIWELVLEEVPEHPQTTRYLEEARSQKQLQEMAAFDGSNSLLLDRIFAGEQAAAQEEAQSEVAGMVESGVQPAAAAEEISGEELFRKGESLYHKGSYRQARELFEQLLLSNPSHPDAYFLLELSKAREADQRDHQDAAVTAEDSHDSGEHGGSAREAERGVDAQPKSQSPRQMYEAAKGAASGSRPGAIQPVRSRERESKSAAPARPNPSPPRTPGPAVKPLAAKPPGARPPTIKAATIRQTGGAEVSSPFGVDAMEAPIPESQIASPAAADDAARARMPGNESTQRLRAASIAGVGMRGGAKARPLDEPDEGARPGAEGAGSPPAADEITTRRMLREYFEVASKAENNGEQDRALELYRKILSISPQSEIAQERASALEMMLQSKKFKQAFDALHKAKALSAREPVLALHEVRKALQLRPELEEAQKLLPLLQKAVMQRRWFRNRPMAAPLLVGVAVIVAVMLWLIFGVFLPQLQEHRVNGLLNTASRLVGQGHYAEAEERILEAQSLSPRSPKVRRVRGRLLMARGEAAAAAEAFRGLVVGGKGTLQDRYLLASALAKAGKGPEAAEYFQDIIAEDPAFHAARREYAWLMLGRGKLAEASDQSNALLASQPEEPENAVLAAALFEKMGMEKEALEQFDKAYTLGLRDANQIKRHIELLIKVNRLEDAQRILNDSRAAFTTDVEFRVGQANIAKRRGRLDEAEEAFRNALILDPKNEAVALELAGVCLAKRDVSAAERVLIGFVERVKSPSGDALMLLGDVQMMRENPTLAAESYRRAQAADPTLPDINRKLDRALKASKGR